MPELSLEALLIRKIRHALPDAKSGKDESRPGIFLSNRFHRFLPLTRPDDNVFFTASILFVLQLYKPHLEEKNQQLAAEIAEAGIAAYTHYQNKHGLGTYNFYRTRPSGHFPNGWLMHRLSHFELPDDADDTALIYLTQPAGTEQVVWLHSKLPQHANLAKLQVKTTLPEAAHLPAYSTWFGQNMPIEFDACVLCNLLFLFYQHRLPLNVHDKASLAFLELVVSKGAYFSNPFRVSPAYPNTAIILYHIVRLVSRFEVQQLSHLQDKLKADVEQAWQQSTNFMERVILDTCRMRLGGENRLEVREEQLDSNEVKRFEWFTAAFLAPFGDPLARMLAGSAAFQMKFACPAMSYALLLEHVLNRKDKQH